MGLHKFSPPLSGRMGTLRTLASIRGAALLEYGCMGHMMYGRVFLNKAGLSEGCKLYSTHIDETDIAMGDTGRLERAIAEIVRRDRPRIVFLLPSAVPTVIGTDLKAICRELQPKYPQVRLLPFGHGGFDVYGYRGVQEALLLLAKTLPVDAKRTPGPSFNLIGSCADLFRFQADAAELLRILKGAFGMEPVCVMTSDTAVGQIEAMGSAHLNLVIRREGLPAAEHLQGRFGIPYLYERPYGIEGTAQWLEKIATLTGLAPNRVFISGEKEQAKTQLAPAAVTLGHFRRSHAEETAICIGGHADIVKGVHAFATDEMGFQPGVCWCDSPDMAGADIPYFAETEWAKAIQAQEKGLLMASGEA